MNHPSRRPVRLVSVALLLAALPLAACGRDRAPAADTTVRAATTPAAVDDSVPLAVATDSLRAYLGHFTDGRHAEALRLYGGRFTLDRRASPTAKDDTARMQYSCTRLRLCDLRLRDVLSTSRLGRDTVALVVALETRAGVRYRVVPRGGGTPGDSTFTFHVARRGAGLAVMELPLLLR